MWQLNLSFLTIVLMVVSKESTDGSIFEKQEENVVNILNGDTIGDKLSVIIMNENETKEIEDKSDVLLREESRKKKKEEKPLVERILPLMIIPFMISTAIIPMMLVSLKAMLLKSAIIGKIAIILMALNFLRRRQNQGGVFSHNVKVNNDNNVAMEHYGYHGDDEYGAYVNRKKKKKK